MIELVNKEIMINANVCSVFAFVTNMENYGKWFPGVIAMQAGNDLAHAQVGKQYLETVNFPDGEAQLLIEVKAAELNRRFVTQSDSFAKLLPQMTVTFSDFDGQCLLHWHFASRNPDLKQTDEFVVSIMQDLNERAEIGLNKLKVLLETG
jgi:uncharacterized protein YndB with AHSA1/START domain